MNTQRKFDLIQKEKLGNYIYALKDPRDKKVFYVGQGINDRVFDHFSEAETSLKNATFINNLSSKIIRIIDIWKNGEDVDWLILAHDLPSENQISDYVESAIVDALSESQNGEPLNDKNPPKSSRLLPEDLEAMAADFVNPTIQYTNVFIFPVQKALNNVATPYEATRTTWSVSEKNRNLTPAFAVGLKNSISKGSFEIHKWNYVEESNKYEFFTKEHPNSSYVYELQNKNWNKVISVAKGFWQRGNYLIAEFDGKGKFRIVHGAKDTSTWYDCL